jgi:hypothetical protein
MNAQSKLTTIFLVLVLVVSVPSYAGEHPRVILTKDGVETIRATLNTVPLFDATVATVRAEVDAEIELGIDTPIPKDYSGGYTHERHKRNFFIAQKAGALYQILEDDKYANYVRDMLFQYEAMYKDLRLPVCSGAAAAGGQPVPAIRGPYLDRQPAVLQSHSQPQHLGQCCSWHDWPGHER